MKTVIISPKFQIVIPSELCRQRNIQPGHTLKARVREGHIELTPERPMTAARGFLPGLDTQIGHEKDRV
jgi:AbrB family looped-hinge helix DNA binding protein